MNLKYILIITLISFLTIGCELNNNPTSKVEELLASYQKLDKNIEYNYQLLSNDELIKEEEYNRYKNIIKKQYRNMSYEIKEEKIDGDIATVTAEIEVIDYRDILKEQNQEERIKKLKEAKEKITYTIDFNVIKDKNNNWKIEKLTEEQQLKLLGIY